MKEKIKDTIQQAVAKLYPENRDIDFDVSFAPDNIEADLASNVAMVLGKKLGEKPMDVAEGLKEVILNKVKDLDSSAAPQNDIEVSVASPGFLNFTFDAAYWQGVLSEVLEQKDNYGSSGIGKGQKVNVESVSANPTGPLTVGHGRGAIIGLVLSNIFKSQGYDVTREYYYNDAGLQMKKLGESVQLRGKQLLGESVDFPGDLYQGSYISDIAKQFIDEKGIESADALEAAACSDFAAELIFSDIKATLGELGVSYDNFAKESDQDVEGVLGRLEQAGVVYEKDGAKWLKLPPSNSPLTKGGSEGGSDRVLVRATGEPTYRLPDIAYHEAKAKIYGRIINILGSDHIAQFPDIQYAVTKLGLDGDKIFVLINQFVTLKGGRKMSTRKAEYVTLSELIAEAGADVTKFFMAMSAPSTHMTFDLELARDTSDKNPVYKVQYAHARINSILQKAKEKGVILNEVKDLDSSVLSGLQNEIEIGLIKELSKYPELLGDISENYNLHQVPHYMLALSDKLHSFYEKIRVISDDKELTQARVGLVSGVQTVLANGLRILGIEPMDKM